MSRRTARTAAMQMIFEKVSGGQGGEETLSLVYEELREAPPEGVAPAGSEEPDKEDRAFISRAFDGVLTHQEEIDRRIAETAVGWTIDRMSLVDLTILRLAIWEIEYEPEVPANVAVAEALLLTERYSDPEDKPFVNGILGTIVRGRETKA